MILILGVTASGKGKLAFALAKSIGAEIISIDSMKVYRRMDIGTTKPPKENRNQIPHHLLDVVEPSDSFSVARFLELAQTAIDDIKKRGKPIVAVGGTALYIKSLLYGLFEGPGADEQIREELKAQAQAEGLNKLYALLQNIDPSPPPKSAATTPDASSAPLRFINSPANPSPPFSSSGIQTPRRIGQSSAYAGEKRKKANASTPASKR